MRVPLAGGELEPGPTVRFHAAHRSSRAHVVYPHAGLVYDTQAPRVRRMPLSATDLLFGLLDFFYDTLYARALSSGPFSLQISWGERN